MYNQTCSLDKPKDKSFTFALTRDYIQKAIDSKFRLIVYTFSNLVPIVMETSNVYFIKSECPFLDFVKKHNEIYSDIDKLSFMRNALQVHDSAKLNLHCNVGHEGMRYIKDVDNSIISMFHAGGVQIKERVVVGPFSSIARGTLNDTIIHEDVKIGCGVHIGHNVEIGPRTIIVDGAVIGGSAKIGADCYIGLNAIIRNGIKIADNTMIGMGSCVVKDISYSGKLYAGVPAQLKQIWNGEWV